MGSKHLVSTDRCRLLEGKQSTGSEDCLISLSMLINFDALLARFALVPWANRALSRIRLSVGLGNSSCQQIGVVLVWFPNTYYFSKSIGSIYLVFLHCPKSVSSRPFR